MSSLNGKAFELLLGRLDPDKDLAGQEYVTLRHKIVMFLRYQQGCPDSKAADLADETLNRLANTIEREKTEQTVIIKKNISSFAHGIAKLVWLEEKRKNKEHATDDLPEPPVKMVRDGSDESVYLVCLKKCLVGVIPEEKDRQLILDYYDRGTFEKIKQKRAFMAETLGLVLHTLAVKVGRLRLSLEECINECVKEKMALVTKS